MDETQAKLIQIISKYFWVSHCGKQEQKTKNERNQKTQSSRVQRSINNQPPFF